MTTKIKTEQYETHTSTITYYTTTDGATFYKLSEAEVHQKFIDEVVQYHFDTTSTLSNLYSVYLIKNQSQLDTFIAEMEQFERLNDYIHYEVDVYGKEQTFPLELCMVRESYGYDDGNCAIIDTWRNVFTKWEKEMEKERALYGAAIGVIWNLDI